MYACSCVTSAPTLPRGFARVPSGFVGPCPETYALFSCTLTKGKVWRKVAGAFVGSGSAIPSSFNLASIFIRLISGFTGGDLRSLDPNEFSRILI